MLFGKKRRPVHRRRKTKRKGHVDMIDIRDLQKKGKVLGPDKEMPELDTDSEGYVRVGSSVTKTVVEPVQSDVSSADVMSLIESKSSASSSFSSEKEGYSKRQVDAKIQDLDSQIYKLEQRIDLLERKLGIDSGYSSPSPPEKPSSSANEGGALGIMGW